jgi:hypothetical protein
MPPRPDLGRKRRLAFAGSRIEPAAEPRADATALAARMHGELKKTLGGLDPQFRAAEAEDPGAPRHRGRRPALDREASPPRAKMK